MIPSINRIEALTAFAARHPNLSIMEVEPIFDQWLECGALDFRRDESGQWRVILCSPGRKQ
jgi:hypothetical protein